MNANWNKPDNSTLSDYQINYIKNVPDGNLIQILTTNLEEYVTFFNSLSVEKINFRYAEGKWTIAELLVHIIDTERIFNYRMLCIARGDKSPLPGFDENKYAQAANVSERNFKDILEEYIWVRKATLKLLESFNNTTLNEIGTANNTSVSVKTIAYMLAGHEMHHIKIIKERYL